MSKARADGECPTCGAIVPARDIRGRGRVECRRCRQHHEVAVVVDDV